MFLNCCPKLAPSVPALDDIGVYVGGGVWAITTPCCRSFSKISPIFPVAKRLWWGIRPPGHHQLRASPDEPPSVISGSGKVKATGV
ncbi:hypothetical protein Taro_030744 [Colocasia esculenta]|uniref:Uncharacterized protein n=1 Tax=Colocasia esculenta TaxID=4460 RepID=A0A843W137_COLES|nr:hypothetical protein [Colocasia esculenta]